MNSLCLVLVATCLPAIAQTFEAATLKPSVDWQPGMSMGPKGGPGTETPTRYECRHCQLSMILESAYGMARHQIVTPASTDGLTFDIAANVPAGESRAQFQTMLQSLLHERLNLTAHREKKPTRGYDLIVATNGPKMNRVREGRLPPGSDPLLASLAAGDAKIHFEAAGSKTLTTVRSYRTMNELAELIGRMMKAPVSNGTKLEGRFDVTLTYGEDKSMMGFPFIQRAQEPSGGPVEELPTLFQAVQELGLKLQPTMVSVELLVLDHVNKTPLPN